jgi:hypothetical protein
MTPRNLTHAHRTQLEAEQQQASAALVLLGGWCESVTTRGTVLTQVVGRVTERVSRLLVGWLVDSEPALSARLSQRSPLSGRERARVVLLSWCRSIARMMRTCAATSVTWLALFSAPERAAGLVLHLRVRICIYLTSVHLSTTGLKETICFMRTELLRKRWYSAAGTAVQLRVEFILIVTSPCVKCTPRVSMIITQPNQS